MLVKVNGKEIEIDYEILSVNVELGQLRVRYFSAYLPQGTESVVELPVENGAVVPLQGDSLRDYIIGVGPMLSFARAEAAGKTDLEYLERLVDNKPNPPEPPAPVPLPRAVVFQFTKKVRKA